MDMPWCFASDTQCPRISTVFFGATLKCALLCFCFFGKCQKRNLLSYTLKKRNSLFTAAAQIQLQLSKDRRRWRKRSIWTRCWLRRRQFYGQYERLMSEVIREDERGFRNYTRICPELYQELVERVGPRLLKKDTFKYSFLTIVHAVELPYNFRGTSVARPWCNRSRPSRQTCHGYTTDRLRTCYGEYGETTVVYGS